MILFQRNSVISSFGGCFLIAVLFDLTLFSSEVQALGRMNRAANLASPFLILLTFVPLILELFTFRRAVKPSSAMMELLNALSVAKTAEEMAEILKKKAILCALERERVYKNAFSARFAGLIILIVHLSVGAVWSTEFRHSADGKLASLLIGFSGLLCLCLLQIGERRLPFLFGLIMPLCTGFLPNGTFGKVLFFLIFALLPGVLFYSWKAAAGYITGCLKPNAR